MAATPAAEESTDETPMNLLKLPFSSYYEPSQSVIASVAAETITRPDLVISRNPRPRFISSTTAKKKWPGWPGQCVFRLLVPAQEVAGLIGRYGTRIEKMRDETRAGIQIFPAPKCTPLNLVFIYGKEEPEAPLSPAMDAALRTFKYVSAIEFGALGTIEMKLLVPSLQAVWLIGRRGGLIQSIIRESGASVRIYPEGEGPWFVREDERIVNVRGRTLKVLNALESIVSHLRRFLVHQSVIPVFRKNYYDAMTVKFYPVEIQRDNSQLRHTYHSETSTAFPGSAHISLPRNSLRGHDPLLSSMHSSLFSLYDGTIVTQEEPCYRRRVRGTYHDQLHDSSDSSSFYRGCRSFIHHQLPDI